eukprot:m.290707 g.290707  ORF g.290707 m.290707 type:complete len:166 (+) comp55084_c0_seq2:366-863(+)
MASDWYDGGHERASDLREKPEKSERNIPEGAHMAGSRWSNAAQDSEWTCAREEPRAPEALVVRRLSRGVVSVVRTTDIAELEFLERPWSSFTIVNNHPWAVATHAPSTAQIAAIQALRSIQEFSSNNLQRLLAFVIKWARNSEKKQNEARFRIVLSADKTRIDDG